MSDIKEIKKCCTKCKKYTELSEFYRKDRHWQQCNRCNVITTRYRLKAGLIKNKNIKYPPNTTEGILQMKLISLEDVIPLLDKNNNISFKSMLDLVYLLMDKSKHE